MTEHRSKFVFLILTLLSLAANGYGQNNPVDLNAPLCQIISLPYLNGEIALSLGEQKMVEKMMVCFLKLWVAQIPTAETESRSISNSFLFAMSENPQAFFDAFATQPDVFSQWLGHVAKLSFSPESSSCHLQEKRIDLLRVLRKTHIIGAQQGTLKNSAISALSQIPNSKTCK